MSTVRIALVGLGDIGMSAHLPALLRQPKARLTALVDPDQHRGTAASAATGGTVPTFVDMATALTEQRIDAVILATPPWITTGLIAEVLGGGRYVLAEKPVATSTAAAAGLAELPTAQRNRLQVGLTYRHDPAIGVLRQWIVAGRLGRPLLLRAHVYDERRDRTDPEHLARITATLAHGMPLVHEGAHVFDWLRFLLGGQAEAIEDAWSLTTTGGLPAPNITGARLRYPDAVALVEFGWLTDALPRCEIGLLGELGYAVLDGGTFRLELTTAAGHEVVEFAGDRTSRCFDLQLERFLALVSGELAEPVPNLDDGLAAVEIGEQIAEAAGRSL